VIAVDSSVVIAGFASWSEQHREANEVLDEDPRLVAHAALESFSVLTRLPRPHRAPAQVVHDYLVESFPGEWLTLTTEGHRELLQACLRGGITGGALYDALIARTAASHGAELASCDQRAAATYRALGVGVIPVGWVPDA
jgi:predicted nucleic acid-binding protein